ncbi:MAG: TatD family deoxyribonuclease [Acidimicrobiia bacterium]|nr:TatD family deoxyribonuclease [Acidimicrobiia bacterium]
MTDSHCHLAGTEFTADLDDVVARARAAGVSRALVILAAEDVEERARASHVAAVWEGVRFAVGLHPHHAARGGADHAGAAGLVEEALRAEPRAVALGEIGLDYHYDFSPRDLQQTVFRDQIRLARRLRLPIVIHTREAEDDTFRILEEESAGDVGGVFHCFTGDRAMARRALDAGFHLSLSGIVTFPKAAELREVARMAPADRLLVETDSPYLAPVPHRGKRCEPAFIVRVAATVAAERGVSVDALAETTDEAYGRLFAIDD